MSRFQKIYKRTRKDVSYLGIRLIVMFFRLLPRRTALSFGSMLGRSAPVLFRKDYALSVKHLSSAFGREKDENEIRLLARETFRHVAMNFVDVARLQKMSMEEVKSVCIPHNLNLLKDTIAQGHGVIGLTSHTGCWELLGVYLAAVGIPIAVVTRRLYDPRLEDMLLVTRIRGGMKNISRGQDTRDIIRALKKGYLLGVLVDQDTNVKGDFVNFFGRPAHTATAPAILSLRYKSPILPIFTFRDEKHRHHICIGTPVEIQTTEDFNYDVLQLTAKCSLVTERFIREHPEQWVWFHRRWKTKKLT